MPNRPGDFLFRRPYLLWTILAINFLASLYGYYWYRWQLAATPRWLWLFTPDCPLAATMMALALGLHLIGGVSRGWFHLLTYTTLLKYGFWTVFVFALYWVAGGGFYAEYVMLFVSHLGMLAEGAIFLDRTPQNPRHWWLAAGWSLLFDFFDYLYPIRIAGRAYTGVYPYLPNEAHLPVVRAMAFAISLGFAATAFVMARRVPRRAGLDEARTPPVSMEEEP